MCENFGNFGGEEGVDFGGQFWKIQWGGRVIRQIPSVGGMDIFWNHTLQVANIIIMTVQNAHNYLHYLYTATEFNVSYLSMKSDRP